MNTYDRHSKKCGCSKCSPFKMKETKVDSKPEMSSVEKMLGEIMRQNQEILEQQDEILEKLDNLSRDGGDFSVEGD